MKLLIVFATLALLLAACGKDKFQTTPQLKIKSVSTKHLAFNESLSVLLEFTDKEGDVSDSFFIVRQRLNLHNPLTMPPLPYPLPQYPKAQKGEIEVNLDFQTGVILALEPIRIPGSNPEQNEPDTMILKFVAKDKGGHYSDTATVDNLIVERQ